VSSSNPDEVFPLATVWGNRARMAMRLCLHADRKTTRSWLACKPVMSRRWANSLNVTRAWFWESATGFSATRAKHKSWFRTYFSMPIAMPVV
jgi:hypothetical protein